MKPKTALLPMQGMCVASISCLLLGAPTLASAQEVLPFPPKPSGSIANRTMQESVYSPLPAPRPQFCSGQNLPTGKVKIEVETVYAVQRPAGPLNVTLKVNGAAVANGQVPVSAPLIFTANDCLDIGIDLGSPVALDYFDKAPFALNGKIDQVQVKYLQ